MKPIEGWDAINEAGELKSLTPGPQPIIITKIVNNPEKEYIEIYSDICSGEFKNYFKFAADRMGKDISKDIRSYKQNALPFFKAFITAIEKSNPGFMWDWDEQKLVGKYCVGNFGEEEYLDKNGEVKISCRIQEYRSISAWKEGKIKAPELLKLPEELRAKPEPKVEEQPKLPFDDDDFPY